MIKAIAILQDVLDILMQVVEVIEKANLITFL